MPGPGIFYSIMQTDQDNFMPVQVLSKIETSNHSGNNLRTSEKIRHLLTKFPSSKPGSFTSCLENPYENICSGIVTNRYINHDPIPSLSSNTLELIANIIPDELSSSESVNRDKGCSVVGKVIMLLQLAVGTTALILYYVIFCWMQFVYNIIRVTLYFRNADGPMKITLGVVAVTSLLLSINFIMRIQKLYISILR